MIKCAHQKYKAKRIAHSFPYWFLEHDKSTTMKQIITKIISTFTSRVTSVIRGYIRNTSFIWRKDIYFPLGKIETWENLTYRMLFIVLNRSYVILAAVDDIFWRNERTNTFSNQSLENWRDLSRVIGVPSNSKYISSIISNQDFV